MAYPSNWVFASPGIYKYIADRKSITINEVELIEVTLFDGSTTLVKSKDHDKYIFKIHKGKD